MARHSRKRRGGLGGDNQQSNSGQGSNSGQAAETISTSPGSSTPPANASTGSTSPELGGRKRRHTAKKGGKRGTKKGTMKAGRRHRKH